MDAKRMVIGTRELILILIIFLAALGVAFFYLIYPELHYRLPKIIEIYDVKYATDGRHVFYIERYATGRLTGKDILFYGTADQKNQKKLYVTDQEILEMSPASNYLAFTVGSVEQNSRKLIVMDAKKHKILKEIESTTWLGDIVWHPDGNKLCYTHKDDIYLIDLSTSRKEKLVNGKALHGLAWSLSGNCFLYKSDYERIGRSPSTNSLFLYDFTKEHSRKLLTERNGRFADALFDSIGQNVFYSVLKAKDGSAEICVVDLKSFRKTLLWMQEPRDEENQIFIERLAVTTNDKDLVFSTYDNQGKGKHEGTFYLSISDNSVHKILLKGDMSWDYSPKTNKIVWWDESSGRFKEKEVKF